MSKKPDFYERMLEAKRKKKAFLEQQRIRAEFGEYVPPPQSPTDAALDGIRQRLLADQTPPDSLEQIKQKLHQQKIDQAFRDLERKAQGL